MNPCIVRIHGIILSAPDGPHVGPMNLAIRAVFGLYDIYMAYRQTSNIRITKSENLNICLVLQLCFLIPLKPRLVSRMKM